MDDVFLHIALWFCAFLSWVVMTTFASCDEDRRNIHNLLAGFAAITTPALLVICTFLTSYKIALGKYEGSMKPAVVGLVITLVVYCAYCAVYGWRCSRK